MYSGDRPLKEALILMNNEGISSLAVIDSQHNVVGNISNVDVKVVSSNYSNELADKRKASHKIELRTPS